MTKPKIQFNWGTAIAMLVSFAALITTIYEANILKAQQEAMIWPYFEVNRTYGGDGFGVIAKNSGTGPAIITSVECMYDGQPVANFMDILDQMEPDSTINYYAFNYRALNNTVFRPGEDRMVFLMPWTPKTRMMLQNAAEVHFRVEYRSVLNDYWVYDSQTQTHKEGRFTSPLEFQSSR